MNLKKNHSTNARELYNTHRRFVQNAFPRHEFMRFFRFIIIIIIINFRNGMLLRRRRT